MRVSFSIVIIQVIYLKIYQFEMLLKQTINIKLEKQVQKILCLSTAYDNTIVFSRVINPGKDESIVHVNSKGQVLFEHKYPDIINFFGMINQEEVIVMNVPKSQIDIINLKKKQVRSINHQYRYDDVAQMRIQTFYETKLFAIVEKGTFNDPRLRISYYNYDDTYLPETCKSCTEFQSQEGQWNYQCPIKKANCHSMITWFKYKHEAQVEFWTFDLRDDIKNTQAKLVKFRNTGGQPYNIANFYLNIVSLWEIKKDRYMIVGNTPKQLQNGKNAAGLVNNNYVYDAVSDTLRETNFFFKDQKDNFAWNQQMIEYFYMGPVCVFHTFKHQAGKTLTTPVYYVNNETEQVVAKENWEATCYVNFFVPGFDNATVIEGFYQNGDVKNITVTTKKVMDPRQISLHFMLHLNQDYDDDLLGDAIQLLHS